MKILVSLGVWVIVAVALELLGNALGRVHDGTATAVGSFLVENNVLIGLLCGIYYYFFGGDRLERR